MGIRVWAAAAAMAVCAWAGAAKAVVYEVTGSTVIADFGPTPGDIGDTTPLLTIAPVTLNAGDSVIVHFHFVNSSYKTVYLNLVQRTRYTADAFGEIVRISTEYGNFAIGEYDLTLTALYRNPIGASLGIAQPVTLSQWSVIASAAPEPSTWALMVLGLAGLAFATRRRAQVSLMRSSRA